MSRDVKAGGAYVEITVRDRMKTGLEAAKRKLAGLASVARQISLSVGTAAVSGLVGWGVKLAADAESAKVGFEVMLGSGEAATKMIADLTKMATKTPFEFTDLQTAATTLLNFGVAGDSILPTLQMLGDTSGGDAEKFQRLALAFGQASGKGKLMGTEMLQMVEAGFNPLMFIAQRTGETMGELEKRMSKGGVSIAELQQAFADATGPGGRFFGMLDKKGQMLWGRWSTLVDTGAELAKAIGEAIVPVLKTVVDAAIPVIESITSLAKAHQGVIRVLAIAAAVIAGVTVAGIGLFAVLSMLAPIVTAFSSVALAWTTIMGIAGAVFAALTSPLGILVVSVLALNAALAAGMAYWAIFTQSGQLAMAGLRQIVGQTMEGIWQSIAAGDWQNAWSIAWNAALIAFKSFYVEFTKVWEGLKTFIVSTIISAMQGVLGVIRNTVLMAVDAANSVGASLDRSRIEGAFNGASGALGGVAAAQTASSTQAVAMQEALLKAMIAEQNARIAKHKPDMDAIGDAYWGLYKDKLTIPPIAQPSMIGGTGTGTGGTFSGAIAGLLGRMGSTSVAEQQLDVAKEQTKLLEDINHNIEEGGLAWG